MNDDVVVPRAFLEQLQKVAWLAAVVRSDVETDDMIASLRELDDALDECSGEALGAFLTVARTLTDATT